MSKIEELIQQYCPDGVEYVKLGKVADYIRGITFSKTKELPKGGSGWGVLRANNINLETSRLIFDDIVWISKEVKVKKEQHLYKGDILICAGSGSKQHIGKVAYISEDLEYIFGGFMGVVRCNDKINQLFLFHILRSFLFRKYLDQALKSSTINNLNSAVMRDFPIPIPPLAVQEEIVRILDKFSLLTAELEVELKSELELRRKQYDFYRNQLLSFDSDSDTVQWKKLGEVCLNCDNQRRPITSNKRTKGEYPYYGASGIVDYVESFIFDGDYLLVSEDGANLVARSTPIAFSISGKNWVNNHAHVLKFNTYEERKFVEYYLNMIDLSKFISGGAQPKLNQQNLNQISIPIPPLSEQQRIVDILDRFDALVNDLSDGLPAEIEARRKQYEYYRDTLLTFKRKAE